MAPLDQECGGATGEEQPLITPGRKKGRSLKPVVVSLMIAALLGGATLALTKLLHPANKGTELFESRPSSDPTKLLHPTAKVCACTDAKTESQCDKTAGCRWGIKAGTEEFDKWGIKSDKWGGHQFICSGMIMKHCKGKTPSI